MAGFRKRPFDRAHTDWSEKSEALFFVGLVERGVLTVCQAEAGLAMHERHYETLKKWDPLKVGTFERLRQKRKATLREFRRLVEDPAYLEAARSAHAAHFRKSDRARRRALRNRPTPLPQGHGRR